MRRSDPLWWKVFLVCCVVEFMGLVAVIVYGLTDIF